MQDTETVLNVISKKSRLNHWRAGCGESRMSGSEGGRRKSAPITRSNSPAAYPTPQALAALGEAIPVEPFVPEDPPECDVDPTGEGAWQCVGSPAPIDRILARYARNIPGAHVSVTDLAQAPLAPPAGRIVNSFMRLGAENFGDQDLVAAHVTLFVEKSWIQSEQVHEWSIQFSRLDEEQQAWRPAPAKRVREDQERVYFSIVVPGFSDWMISGGLEAPEVEFRVDNLRIEPPEIQEGQQATITFQVTNLTDDEAVYNSALWLNSGVNATGKVTLGAGATETVTFTASPKIGTYEIRVDRLIGSMSVVEFVAPPTPVRPIITPEVPTATPPAPVLTPEAPTPIPPPVLTPEAPTPIPPPVLTPEVPTPIPPPVVTPVPVVVGRTPGMVVGIIAGVLVAVGVAGLAAALYLRRRGMLLPPPPASPESPAGPTSAAEADEPEKEEAGAPEGATSAEEARGDEELPGSQSDDESPVSGDEQDRHPGSGSP